MNQSALSDSLVLRETRFSPPDNKGRVQLAFVLPSGRKVTSTDWLVPGEIKGKVLIAWATAIRAEDAFDIQQREEQEKLARAEKRARALSSAVHSDSDAPAQRPSSNEPSGSSGTSPVGTLPSSSTLSSLPDDPRELIAAKLSALRTSHEREVALRDASIQRIAEIASSIDQWAAVMRGLLSVSPPPDPPSPASSEPAKEASATEPASDWLEQSKSSPVSTPPKLSRSQRRKVRREFSHAEGTQAPAPGVDDAGSDASARVNRGQ